MGKPREITCVECAVVFVCDRPGYVRLCSDACRQVREQKRSVENTREAREARPRTRPCARCGDLIAVVTNVARCVPCKRAGLETACTHCGVRYSRLPKALGRTPGYCTEACRRAGARATAKTNRENPHYERVQRLYVGTAEKTHPLQVQHECAECAVVFWRAPKTTDRPRRFCSVACRNAAVGRDISASAGSPRIERMDPQQCTICCSWFPLADYQTIKKTGLKYRQCRACCGERGTTPIQKRRSHLRTKFGMTLEAWLTMYHHQGGVCAVCTKELPPIEQITAEPTKRAGTNWGLRDWNTDHCHTTGKVRGILCRKCNHALGCLRDTPTIALAAAAYLEQHRVCDHVLCSTGPSGTCLVDPS